MTAVSTRAGAALADVILAANAPVISVIGLAKNVGKTTVVNAVLRELEMREIPYGVLSVGRDGETHDALDDQLKPAMRIAAGSVALVPRSGMARLGSYEVLRASQFRSATGELQFVRARVATEVELHGPRSAQEMRECLRVMREFVPGVIIVDGALDRLASLVGPEHALILATGSAVDRRLQTVLDRTEALLARLQLPPPQPGEEMLAVDGVLDDTEAARYFLLPEEVALVLDTPMQVTPGAFGRLRKSRALRAKESYRVIGCSTNALARSWSHDAGELARGVRALAGCVTIDCFRDVVLP